MPTNILHSVHPLSAPTRIANMDTLRLVAAHDVLSLTSTISNPARHHLKLVTPAAPLIPHALASDRVPQRSDTCEALDKAFMHAERDREFEVLVTAAATGDAQSFERFYNATIHYAFAVARRVVGASHAEDVLSDAYFQAWRDAKRFDASRGNALSWLLVIVRSRALDRLRAENLRHNNGDGVPDIDSDSIEALAVPGPDTLLESLQAATQLHSAIKKLSSNERWVLALAYFRDLSHSEITALTGLPLGTVKSLINRSQQKLRDMLVTAQGMEPTHTSHPTL